MLRSTSLVVALLAVAAATNSQPVALEEPSKTALTLRNGWVSATFDLLCPRLSAIRGDARGNSSYGANMLVPRTGVRLEMQPFDAHGCLAEESSGSGEPPGGQLPCPYANPPARASAQHGCHSKALGYRVAVNTTSEVSVVVEGVVDSVDSPSVSSAWTLTLRRGARGIELRVQATALGTANVTAVRLSSDFTPSSLYAGYDKGVLQMMDSPHPYYAAPSGNPLRRFYALGGVGDRGGAVEVLPLPVAGGVDGADAVLIARGSWHSGQSGATGLQLVMRGNFTTAGDSCAFRPGLGPKAPGSPVEWTRGWENVAPTRIDSGEQWTTAVCLLANDYAYPPSTGGDAASSCAAQAQAQSEGVGRALGENQHDGTDDEASVLSALYGSAMGVQTTFINHPLGAVVGGLASKKNKISFLRGR